MSLGSFCVGWTAPVPLNLVQGQLMSVLFFLGVHTHHLLRVGLHLISLYSYLVLPIFQAHR